MAYRHDRRGKMVASTVTRKPAYAPNFPDLQPQHPPMAALCERHADTALTRAPTLLAEMAVCLGLRANCFCADHAEVRLAPLPRGSRLRWLAPETLDRNGDQRNEPKRHKARNEPRGEQGPGLKHERA
jgi:hypothetical protein